ncbi:MAG: hypothetical protein IJU91_10760 [Selenomonadaceae bacterium]|nr:hypothetical protein [Selenomonadaceae bacterium]
MAITKEVLLNTLSMYKKHADTYYNGKFVAKVDGKGLSTNDYTTAEKTKLNGIADSAQVNVIESITIDGNAQPITNKSVALDLSAYAKVTDIASALVFKGSVENFSNLPATGNSIGDAYNIKTAGGTDANGTTISAGDVVAYTETGWVVMAGATDLSNYVVKETGKGLSTNDYTTVEKEQLAALIANANETISDAEITAIFAA